MKILLHENVQLEFADIRNRTPINIVHGTVARSPGVHLSGVLREYALKAEILTPSELDEDEYPLRMALGVAWEEFLASLYPETAWWPGEWVRDGVAGNPDGVGLLLPEREDLDDPSEGWKPAMIIEEVKYTHKSCSNGRDVPNLNDRQGVKDWMMWLNQGMGYCNLHPSNRMPADGGIEHLRPRLVRYHVLYGCGDYVRPYKERYVRTLVEFTDKELDKNWETVQKYKRLAKAERERGVKQ